MDHRRSSIAAGRQRRTAAAAAPVLHLSPTPSSPRREQRFRHGRSRADDWAGDGRRHGWRVPVTPGRSRRIGDQNRTPHVWNCQETMMSNEIPTTALGMFRHLAARRPDAVQLIYFDTVLSVGEVDELSDALAAALESEGVGPGERIAAFMQ